MIFRKSQIYLLIGLVIMILIFALIAVFQGENSITPIPSPSPISRASIRPNPGTFTPSQIKPILINEVPFKPEAQGGGVNLESVLVQESQEELEKLLPLLPYESALSSESGKTISILIPGPNLQATPWVLDVQIYGVNYQVAETDTNYTTEKAAFLSAASNVFDWIKSNNVDPEKIIINWGDRAYIRDQTQKWLSQ